MIRSLTKTLISTLITALSIAGCAKVSSPTGGPKDTIPPILLESRPYDQQLNFEGKTINLKFDEYIQIDKITDQLIITPKIQGKYSSKINKTSLKIVLDSALKNNTTYTFNFREGVKDLTERNAPKSLSIAFSTGDYIDSLTVYGKVTDLFTNKPKNDITVGIYPLYDTAFIFEGSPTYFTKTNKAGQFSILNIKNDKYLLYAFSDKNKNLKAEPDTEKYSFYADTLDLTLKPDSIFLKLFQLNVLEPKINSARSSGKYFEVKFNKYIEQYTLHFPTSTDTIFSNLVDENRTLRIYNTIDLKDSLAFHLSALDTLGQIVQDSFYLKYLETKRNYNPYEQSIKIIGGKKVNPNIEIEIAFNKPIIAIKPDSIFFKFDSLTHQKIDPLTDFQWNITKDRLTINKLIDTTLFTKPTVLIDLSDTTNLPKSNVVNSTKRRSEDMPDIRGQQASVIQKKTFNLILGTGTFITTDSDSSALILEQLSLRQSKDYGIVRGNVYTQYKNYLIQLLNNKFDIVQELASKTKYEFRDILPGAYTIRVLIDANNNGKWDIGNIKTFTPPEPIYFYKKTLPIKANWELNEENLTF